jgi:hypothetical protein
MPEPLQIVWTAVPRRALSGDELELAAVISFRLAEGQPPDPPLELRRFFPELEDWPKRLASYEWQVEVNGGAARVSARGNRDPLKERPELWTQIFPARTPVRPWRFRDHADRVLWSYPLTSVRDLLLEIYRACGGHGGEVPGADLERAQPLWQRFADARGMVGDFDASYRQRLRQRAERRAGGEGEGEPIFGSADPQDPLADPRNHVAACLRFYERPEMQSRYEGRASLAAAMAEDGARAYYLDRPPSVDFHEALGALADYPTLTRMLGLVIDLRFKWPVADAIEDVRLLPTLNGETGAGDIRPRTHCLRTPGLFLAQPGPGSDYLNGVLDLSGAGAEGADRYDLVQLDVDGALLKAVNAAATWEARGQRPEEERATFAELEEQPTSAPSDAGIAIVRKERAAALQDQLLSQRRLHEANVSGQTPEVWAEDLVRGHRIEIEFEDSWYSLHRRRARYRVRGQDEIATDEDEGYTKSASATSKDTASDLYLHEAVARWPGWSLSVPRPGKAIVPRPGVAGHRGKPDLSDPKIAAAAPTQTESTDPRANLAETELGLETRFTATGASLPRLRYGAKYRAAVTWVDLSGRPAFALDDVPERRPSEAVVFRRHDPIAPPAVVPRIRFSDGESLERLVIRSDPDHSAKQYLDQTLAPLAARGRVEYREACERHLAPPKVSQEMAERHGCFEDAFGGTVRQRRAAWLTARRESGNFDDAEIPALDDPNGTISAGSPRWIEPEDPKAEGQGRYVINDIDRLALPYLPDPLARGITLRGVDPSPLPAGLERADPPGSDPALLVSWDGDWPELRPIRLRLVERDPGDDPVLRWDPDQGVLTVALAKAETLSLLYSSRPRDDVFHSHAIVELLDGTDATALAQARVGAHWMLSPYRTLRLVHAVQYPLEPPKVDLQGDRPVGGSTHASLRGICGLHGPSTGQLDLLASWADPLDDPQRGAPRFEPEEQLRQEGIRVERYLNDGSWMGEVPLPAVKGDNEPAGEEGGPAVIHEFADTRHHLVSYQARATTTFREHFPRQIRDDEANLTVDGEPQLLRIRSSRRPPAPMVVSVLPAFSWSEENGSVLTRRGGALRVYLARPWFETGAGERLAVVVEKRGLRYDTADNPLISKVGRDPIWDAPFSSAGLNSELFLEQSWPPPAEELIPGEDPPVPEATLAEQGDLPVALAAYSPDFDPDRDLWYCDLVLDLSRIPGYWPFIRLALARWQPFSLAPSISSVVVCDFAQLAPDRSLTVTRAGDDVSLTLRGRGPAPDSHPQVVRFELQSSEIDPPDELDWEPFGDAIEPVLGTPDGDELQWTETLRLPPGEFPLRVTVSEYEAFWADPGVGEQGLLTRIVHAQAVRLR